ncbi:major strawberry allergen Fra a 1-E-like [Pistacia vera]|uniref:major strawberry allergen Fra a 1-E-like n=1 Tax=Pistacia vera TaxID=55513 RepID=UPI001263D6DE|nr:major strawberry allergen Fra a 1-E-like [Pistacia vera]
MKNMKGEVVLNLPAETAWEMFRNNQIISKINPEMLAHAEYIQGDGSPGSLRLFKLGPAVQSYVKESTQKIEKVESGKSVTYLVVEGDLKSMYDPYRVTFSFIPLTGKEKEMCKAEWEVEFEPLTPATPPPDKARDAALGFLKSFDKFQLSY